MLRLRPTAPKVEKLIPDGVGYDAIGVVDFAGWEAEVAQVAETSDDEHADFAERLVRRFLTLCENPRTRKRMLGLVKASTTNAKSGQRVYALINKTVVNPLARKAGVHASALRLEIVASQLFGLAMMRYVLEIEPVASTPIDELVRRTAPAIRAALSA